MEKIFTFNSTREMHNFCATATAAGRWRAYEGSENSDKLFSGTANFEEAQKLLISGAPAIVRDLAANLDNIARRAGDVARVVHGVAGFAPCVPAALAGRPDSMYMRRKKAAPAPVVNLYYANGFPAFVKGEKIIEIGSYVLAAVRDLEARGVRVALHVCNFANMDKAGKNVIGVICRVKSAGDAFSLAAVSYPLAHPSFLRRSVFRCRESCGDPALYCSGYGWTRTEIDKFLPSGALAVVGANFINNPAGVLDYIKNGLK